MVQMVIRNTDLFTIIFPIVSFVYPVIYRQKMTLILMDGCFYVVTSTYFFVNLENRNQYTNTHFLYFLSHKKIHTLIQ